MHDIEGGALTLAGKSCLIQYDEDVWLGLPADRQDYCKKTWLEKATTMPDVAHVVLRLIPDELFPMHGNEKPYVAWQEAVDRPPECGYVFRPHVYVLVSGTGKYIDPVMRADISRDMEKYPRGTSYTIMNDDSTVIDSGKV